MERLVSEGENCPWSVYTKGVTKRESIEKKTPEPATSVKPFLKKSAPKDEEFGREEQRENPVRPAPTMHTDRALKKHVRRKKTPIQATLDLHGMTQDQAFEALNQFVLRCYAQEKRFVLVITGKGKISPEMPEGVLRSRFKEWIHGSVNAPYVISFTQALQEHGGGGAFYVQIKKKR